MRLSLRLAMAALLVMALLSCRGGVEAEPRPPPASPALPRVTLRPLPSYVPSLGLRWLVHLRPRDLVENEELMADWGEFFREERVRAFTSASGIDPHEVSDAWIAGYDLGVLYVLDAKVVGQRVEEAFVQRSLTSQTLDTGHANLSHVTGMIERQPHALVHVHSHMVAIAEGDIRLARIVAASAQGKLATVAPALSSRFLEPHADFAPDAPVRAFLRGPFESATDAVSGGFISGVVSVVPKGGTLRLEGQALGVWPRAPGLDQRLTAWTDQVLSSRELRALGWGFPSVAPTVTCSPADGDFSLCRAHGEWNSGDIARAVQSVTAGSMRELIERAPANWHPEATTRGATAAEPTNALQETSPRETSPNDTSTNDTPQNSAPQNSAPQKR